MMIGNIFILRLLASVILTAISNNGEYCTVSSLGFLIYSVHSRKYLFAQWYILIKFFISAF